MNLTCKLVLMTNKSNKHTILISFPVHHAPLIVDINTQRSYRKWGYVSWPTSACRFTNESTEQEDAKKILGGGGHVSWPEELNGK